MISSNEVNVLHNGAFRLWDYGSGAFTTNDDRLANRWTLRLVSGAVSIAPVTHGSSTDYPKLIRSEQGMRITVSTLGTLPVDIKVNQWVPKMEYRAPCFVQISGAFFAPLDDTFQVGVGENLITLTGKGATTLVTYSHTVSIDDIGSASGAGEVIAFMNPSNTVAYDLAYFQVEYLRPDQAPAPFSPVDEDTDRLRMLPYCRAIGGEVMQDTSTTVMRWAFTNLVPMRVAPTFYPVITSNLVARAIHNTALTYTATTPVYVLSNTDVYGGLFRISGFASLLNTDFFYRNEGGTMGVLDADF